MLKFEERLRTLKLLKIDKWSSYDYYEWEIHSIQNLSSQMFLERSRVLLFLKISEGKSNVKNFLL